MALGKLPVPGRPTIWITVGQGPTALVVGAGGGCLDIFTLIYPFPSLSPPLWETARYRLKYCLKGLLSPNQPTNQPTCLTNGRVWFSNAVMCLKDADGMAKSVDPDQTAPAFLAAFFAQTYLSQYFEFYGTYSSFFVNQVVAPYQIF